MKLQSLRPNSLNEFVGKEVIKNNLITYIKASQINKQPLDHCLFYGLPGTGKTSLALIVAKEQNTTIRILQGNNIQKPTDVYNFALSIKENDVIFIDEIHSINKECFELLYALMEDYCLDITIGKDFNAKTTRLKVPPFTLIGATTSLAKLPKPLEERFGIVFYFEDYKVEEIKQIITNIIKKTKVELNDDELTSIALNSKGIPRNALTVLSRVVDFKLINPKETINHIFQRIGIYSNGLNNNDIKYLRCFESDSTVLGIKTLAQLCQFEVQFIEEKVEPYLFKNKYVVKTAKGRMILPKGLKFINELN